MRLKITAIFLLFIFLLSCKSYSQDVSLNFKYVSIDTILKEIKKQTNFSYVVGDKKIDSVSIFVREASLPEALAILLEGLPYTAVVYSNYFVIADKIPGVIETKENIDSEAKYVMGPPPANVSGKLIDQDGKPVAGADIQLMRSNKITSTGKDGNFILNKINVEGMLVITHKDYETREFVMIGNTDLGPILLTKKK